MSYQLTDTASSFSTDSQGRHFDTNLEKRTAFKNTKLNKNVFSWNLLKCNSSDDIESNGINESNGACFNSHGNVCDDAYREKCDTLATTSLTNKSLPNRSGAASVIYKNCIYIFGGYRMRNRLNSFYKYNIIENKWSKIPKTKNTPSVRENNPATIYKNKMYIYGGYQGNRKWLNDFHCFDLDTNKWNPVEVKEKSKIYAPPNLFGFALALDEQEGIIYYFGGYDGNELHNKMYAFHIKRNKWIYVNQSGDVPSPRSCANAHIVNGYFYLFGGYNGTNSLNSLYQYHLETGIWTKIQYNIIENKEENQQEERQNVTFGFNDKLKSLKRRDSNSFQNETDVPTPRYFATSFFYNKCIYILGGYDGCSNRLNDFYKFDIYERVWNKVETLNNFTGRSSMNVHLFKSVVYCIAGYDGKNALNDVYALKLENTYVEASTVANDYKLMVNNPRYSDVVFVVENKYAYACKAILSVRCPYFYNLFDSYFNEKNLVQQQVPVYISGVSYDIFLDVLNYIYTDQLNTTYTFDVYIKILLAAIKFDIFRLVQLCEMIICDQINHLNVLDVTILSYRNDCQQLCRFCVDYLVNNKLLDDIKINKLVNEPQLLADIYRRSINC